MSKKLILFFLIAPMGLILGMDKPRGAKRKLFNELIESAQKENQAANQGTPQKKVVGSPDVPDTRPETPGTPDTVRRERLASRGAIQLAVQNMSNKPVMVTYAGSKGSTFSMLAPAKVDFTKSRLDALVSFKHASLTLAPTGEHFMRLVLDKKEPNKLVLEQYMETEHGNGFAPIGDLKVDHTKPVLVQLHTRLNDSGFEHTDIDIINK